MIALIGAHGQLGSDLLRLWGERAVPLTHADIEITDPASIASALDAIAPTIVVNTAAYNAVDRAEDEPSQTHAVNAAGPGHLADYCESRRLTLLHVSTDYVFGDDATRTTPYAEDDPPGPVSEYGLSKWAGEKNVAARCRRHFIVRTCGLYGHAIDKSKGNFVRTMLKLAETRDELRVVADQHNTPTSTVDLAVAIDALLKTERYGLYHATNAGHTTWHEFAETIFRLTNRDMSVIPITTAEYSAPARRPGYSVLDCQKLADATQLILPDWRTALARYLARPVDNKRSTP